MSTQSPDPTGSNDKISEQRLELARTIVEMMIESLELPNPKWTAHLRSIGLNALLCGEDLQVQAAAIAIKSEMLTQPSHFALEFDFFGAIFCDARSPARFSMAKSV